MCIRDLEHKEDTNYTPLHLHKWKCLSKTSKQQKIASVKIETVSTE